MHYSEVKDEMGKWLGQLAPWDVFSTWTFSEPVSVNAAMYWGRQHLRWLEKTAGNRIHAFVGAEKGNRGGLIHLHALIGRVSEVPVYCGIRLPRGRWGVGCCMVHAWPAGIARVLPYDPARGAAYYVGKYVAKDLAEWELVGFPLREQQGKFKTVH